MFGFSSAKKNKKEEPLFKREAYIPKKRLEKKSRSVPLAPGRFRHSEQVGQSKNIFRKVLVVFLWLCFVGEVIFSLLFAQFFTIRAVDVEQAGEVQSLSSETIQQYVEEFWQGKWYGLFAKNNLLLVSPTHQEDRLEKRFPKIKEVQVSRHFPDRIEVKITEKPYQVLGCSKGECFLIDTEGRAQDPAIIFQYPEEQGRIIRVEDSAEQVVSLGTKVLDTEDQRFVEGLVKDFTLRTGLSWEGNIERPTVYAREMRIRTHPGFVIFFSTRESLEKSLNNLMLLLQKEIPENEWDRIDYVDLRTENRVYYTRKDRAPEKTEEQIKREEEAQKKREAENSESTEPKNN